MREKKEEVKMETARGGLINEMKGTRAKMTKE